MDRSTGLGRLFIVSYVPLTAIAAVRLSDGLCVSGPTCGPTARASTFWLMVALLAFGLVDAWRLPRLALKRASIKVTFSDVADEGGSVAGYLATYLLPFLGFSVQGWRDLVSIVIYGGVLFSVFLRSDLGIINPTFYIAGYRVVSARWEVSTDRVVRALVLCRKNEEPSVDKACRVVTFGRFLILK